MMMMPTMMMAQEYQFSNPSFSGEEWSQHVLTLEQMKQGSARREQESLDSAARELIREEENSNLNRFLNNFESRVYAQMSKMLVDELFGEDPSDEGSFELGGNTIDYYNDGLNVSLTITDTDGNTTTISIPIGGLGF